MTLPLPSEPWQDGYLAVRQLDADRWLAVAPLTLGRGRLVICDRWSVYDGF